MRLFAEMLEQVFGNEKEMKKESNKKSTKTDKSNSKVERKTVFHKSSGAGKGDVPRTSITQNEWGKKWEKIFRSSEAEKDGID